MIITYTHLRKPLLIQGFFELIFRLGTLKTKRPSLSGSFGKRNGSTWGYQDVLKHKLNTTKVFLMYFPIVKNLLILNLLLQFGLTPYPRRSFVHVPGHRIINDIQRILITSESLVY
jgi:hypothetical protein